jgi:Virulence factor BrkB
VTAAYDRTLEARKFPARRRVGPALAELGLKVIFHVADSGSTGGAVVALVGWALGSVAFSAYVSNFGNHNKTYGSLAAAIMLMLWLYISSLAILVGADVDAVWERDKSVMQTTPPAQ